VQILIQPYSKPILFSCVRESDVQAVDRERNEGLFSPPVTPYRTSRTRDRELSDTAVVAALSVTFQINKRIKRIGRE
jgi:hypothetical protein